MCLSDRHLCKLCTKDFSGFYFKANQVHLTLKLTRVRVTGIETQKPSGLLTEDLPYLLGHYLKKSWMLKWNVSSDLTPLGWEKKLQYDLELLSSLITTCFSRKSCQFTWELETYGLQHVNAYSFWDTILIT